ncbi:MAG: acyltransferase family protein [Actinomycetes bacterium]
MIEAGPIIETNSRIRVKSMDGLRGLAVAAVVVYHLCPELVPGGFLGVSVFFVLSGYLITTLLLGEATTTSKIRIREFWGRRFRRLMPTAFAALALALIVAAAVGDAHQLKTLPGDVTAAALYVANWRFIALGTSYGAHYQQPSVVLHFWSLAIEEQFYLVVAIVAALLARFGRSRRAWLMTFGALALASMASTVLLGPDNTTRIYFGTTTRAFELLAGSVLGIVLAGRAFVPRSRSGRRGLQAAGVVALGALIASFILIRIDNPFLYRGGFWVVAGVTIVALVALRSRGPIAWFLAWRPLVMLGIISYGVYLYHWPLFIWLTPATTHLDGLALAAIRVGATLLLAILSYVFLEQPIRKQRWHQPLPALAGIIGLSFVLVIGSAFALGRRANDRAIVAAPNVSLATATTMAGTPATAPVGDIDTPRSVLVVGDSVLHDALPSITADFAAAGVTVTALGAPGETLVSNSGRWLSEISQVVETKNPDIVVLESCCGSLYPFVAVDGTVTDIDTPVFWELWATLVGQATERAGARGARVMWVLPPPVDGVRSLWYGDVGTRMASVIAIERGLAAAQPNVQLIDWGVLAAADRTYAATLPDEHGNPVVIRADDGLHFTPAGQAIQARTTVDQVLNAWQSSGGRPDHPASVPGA